MATNYGQKVTGWLNNSITPTLYVCRELWQILPQSVASEAPLPSVCTRSVWSLDDVACYWRLLHSKHRTWYGICFNTTQR